MDGEPLGRNDTYGYALAAQPDKSQGRPTTNTGSQPSVQNGLPTRVPRRPLFRTVAPYAQPGRQASRTTNGPPRHFIPGTNLIESMNTRLWKVTRNRGQFPSEQAALKVLYLAVRDRYQGTASCHDRLQGPYRTP